MQKQNLTSGSNENTETIPTFVQIKNILEKLISFDDRIKRIEELNQDQNQVNILINIKKEKNFNPTKKT